MAYSALFQHRSWKIWTAFDIRCSIPPPARCLWKARYRAACSSFAPEQLSWTATSRGGKTVTLGFAAPGEAVGVGRCRGEHALIKFTAEPMERSEISVISGPDFRQFLRAHGEAAFRVAEHLSVELHRMIGQNRLLSLAPNA